MREIIDIFPSPVVRDIVQLDTDERKFMLAYKGSLTINLNKNYSTDDSYILNKLPKLKKHIIAAIKNYNDDITCQPAKIEITQSWMNINPPGTEHHHHFHPNSIISGVYYVQTDEDTGNFILHKPFGLKSNIQDDQTRATRYNHETTFFTPKNGELYLFPSLIWHGVLENKSNIDRVSLSFNTFYRGKFGNRESKTEAYF
jgi:uncharacterized protein (TIGR02466 family)